jgi:hypothetical protein
MSTQTNVSSLTIEEAVARMVSLEYLPQGFTVQDMTAAFLEDAEAKYEYAIRGNRESQAIRANVCEARHALARALFAAMDYELERGDDSALTVTMDSTGIKRVTTESLSDWASDQFGITAPEWEPWYQAPTAQEAPSGTEIRWEDITIKIYADHQIGCLWGNGKTTRTSFIDLGLKGKRKNVPNERGAILIGLSQGRKFPRLKLVKGKDKAAISKLRRSLGKLTGLTSDPLRPYNEADGWLPRFKLIDDRRNADARAKATARGREEMYDDTQEYAQSPECNDESDAAGDVQRDHHNE